MDLYDAYGKNTLPSENGFIISSFFSPNSAYSRYEIVSYNNVKSIYPSEDGLTFQTDGKKLYILVEPMSYSKKSEEPYVRSRDEQIPLRFSELELHTCKNQTKIYWAKKSIMSYTSFTVLKPTGVNFSFAFYPLPDIFDSMELFFEKTFNKEAGAPMPDARKVSKALKLNIQETMTWEYTSE
ncbi:MAG: hypothetical protein E4H20_01000 [Spirochaetales bacterium]|nr:MAG: hypothetical protein E4H20_01000 [Spirochaetales bacterium]